jgi:hypothetical protein
MYRWGCLIYKLRCSNFEVVLSRHLVIGPRSEGRGTETLAWVDARSPPLLKPRLLLCSNLLSPTTTTAAITHSTATIAPVCGTSFEFSLTRLSLTTPLANYLRVRNCTLLIICSNNHGTARQRPCSTPWRTSSLFLSSRSIVSPSSSHRRTKTYQIS